MVQKRRFSIPVLQALLAAVLFALSAPLAKLILGEIDPIPLAAFLYLGSGVGALLLQVITRLTRPSHDTEARLVRKDIPWLIGAIFLGGVLAPILLLFGLKTTPASTTSLLLNFESVATALIAGLIFREAISRRIGWAILLITLASMLLTLTWGDWGFTPGAFLILAACISWGMDNNLTRQISTKDPLQIVAFKGLGAGSFSLILGIILGIPLPSIKTILLASALGAVSYGLSIALIILSMRALGSVRAYALFGSAPFISVLISLFLFKNESSVNLWISLPIMLVGAWLMLSEDHSHVHAHHPFSHEHAHNHPDPHHNHVHAVSDMEAQARHSHPHTHDPLIHDHKHTPDIHHRHTHEEENEENHGQN